MTNRAFIPIMHWACTATIYTTRGSAAKQHPRLPPEYPLLYETGWIYMMKTAHCTTSSTLYFSRSEPEELHLFILSD